MKFKPMLAKRAEKPFSSPDYIFEVKWDGIRAIAYTGEDPSLRSRNDVELLPLFPELGDLRDMDLAVLDGELVVFREGRPDFQLLLQRINAQPFKAEVLSKRYPATYIVFDLLSYRDRVIIEKKLLERKKLLEEIDPGRRIAVSMYIDTHGEELFEAVIQKGLEGIIAKKKDSPYLPGKRSNYWLKIKGRKSADFVVIGYLPGKGERSSSFGSLTLGVYSSGELVPVGRVGTGFSKEMLEYIKSKLKPLPEHTGREIRVKPEIVVEVEYGGITKDMKLRFPRFVRLRPDKKPEECTADQLIMINGNY